MKLDCRSWVEISNAQIARNYRAVRAVVGGGVEIAGVVKANAYGHGMVDVSRTLEGEGIRWFAVSSAEEGVALREAGIRARILVMADCFAAERTALISAELTPVVQSLDDLRALDEFAGSRGVRLRFHLKIDTGMGRLGTLAGADAIAEAVRAARNLELEGLMSHFASAGDYTTSQTADQVRVFDNLVRELCELGITPPLRHIASSSPIACGYREAWQTMVRPGLALYGYIPAVRGQAPERILDVKPALTWKAAVLATKDVPAGATIGYGALFRAPKPMRIAVVAAGYADGVPHRLSNRGRVIAAGKSVPILGAVSMDVTTIDVTECPSIQVGDAVTLLGSENGVSVDAQEIAAIAGTIPYDVLCGIRARVTRVYV